MIMKYTLGINHCDCHPETCSCAPYMIYENERPRPKGRGIKDKNKMLKLTNPWLRRSNVMLNSFGSCISDAPKEFSRAPEMSSSEMVSKPRVFLHQLESTVTFEQLQSFADTHGDRHLNEEMDMINTDVEFINLEPFSVGNLSQKKFTIHFKPIKLKGIFGIFNFPDKMESILSEAMFPGFQIHFLSPKSAGDKAHANFDVYFEESSISTLPNIQTKELNLMRDGDSSPNLKVWVSSPWM